MRTSGGAGFGGSGSGGAGFGMPGDVGALAQQWMKTMADAMRGIGAAAQPQDPWQAAFSQWSQLAGGGRRDDAGEVIERFSAQARQWLGMMQQVAGQFAGQDAGPADIAAHWREAMGVGANPFADLFSGMAGRGQAGFDQWYAQVAPYLGGMLQGGLREETLGMLRMPAFGQNREHQERLQALAAAQIALQQKNDEYNALMLEVGQDAFVRFERKLAERSEPGRQLKSARALFDLWIDAAEEAYADVALSPRFRRLYGDLVNAQMRVRAGIQREVEAIGNLFGMPGRSEVDAAHRKIAELERQLRRLRDAAPSQRPAGGTIATASPAKKVPAAAETASTPAAKRTAVPSRRQAPKAVVKAAAKASVKSVAKPAAKSAGLAKPGPAETSAKAEPAAKRAARSGIAAIAIPEPLQPMTAKKATKKTAKRAR